MIHVVIVAPYTSVRTGLRTLLMSFAEMEIVGEAPDADSLRYYLNSGGPDAVLYDASAGGLEPVLTLLAEARVPIVALCDDPEEVSLLARSRDRGWAALQRTAGGEEIAGALHAAVSGIVAIDPAYVAIVYHEPAMPLEHDEEEMSLTPREREVLQLMTHGLPNKNIANRLQISLSTVKFHVASILTKLNASSRTEAVTVGARRGLVSL